MKTNKILLFLISIFSFAVLQAAQTDKKPNVVFFFLDDSGWGDFSCYGATRISTPNFDGAASKGVLFTNFYVTAPVCSPSRVGAMTGQSNNRLGVHHIFGSAKLEKIQGINSCEYLDPKIPTITKAFKDGGYYVGHFGKWHLSSKPLEQPLPPEYGIDKYKIISNAGVHFVFPKDIPQNALSTEYIVNEAIEFVDEAKKMDKPFYLQVWTILPHAPITPTKEQLARVHKSVVPDVKDGKPKLMDFTSPQQIYYSAILEVDYQFGRLVKKLKDEGVYENTIIIISSDNGPESIEITSACYSAAGRTGVFRGQKRSLYEGGIRVAGIISWPEKFKTPVVNKDTVMSTLDLFPSLSKICNLPAPDMDKFDGEDMSPAFYGEKITRTKNLYWAFFSDVMGPFPRDAAPILAMRKGKWKFHVNPDGSRLELYDIEADPMQVDNVANEHPELAKELKETMLNYYKALPNNSKMVPGAGYDNSKYKELVMKK